MQGLGIQVLLGKQTQALLGNASVQALRFASGEELEAELVVIAAGIRPNAQLATDAGLDVRRGIVCRNLALISEPPEDLPGAKVRADELERDSLPILAVGTLGGIYGSHAPVADLSEDAIQDSAPEARCSWSFLDKLPGVAQSRKLNTESVFTNGPCRH